MKLAIFGATGTAGSELLQHAMREGHEPTVLARNPSRVPPGDAQLSIVEGNVKDYRSVLQTVGACDAVLSTLGTTDRHDPDLRQTGTANIIAAMHEAGIRRLVVLGGFHLPFDGDPDNLGRKLIVPIIKLMGVVVQDTLAMAALVQDSELDWTLVRIPRIVPTPAAGHPEIGTLRLGPWSRVSRATVARLMLECATNAAYMHQAPMVCDRGRAHGEAHGVEQAPHAQMTGAPTGGSR
jgi:putative NADH-flavin reductase